MPHIFVKAVSNQLAFDFIHELPTLGDNPELTKDINNFKLQKIMQKKAESIAPKTVVNLYDFTGVAPLAGIQDYSEAIYEGDPSTNYEFAQNNQHNYFPESEYLEVGWADKRV